MFQHHSYNWDKFHFDPWKEFTQNPRTTDYQQNYTSSIFLLIAWCNFMLDLLMLKNKQRHTSLLPSPRHASYSVLLGPFGSMKGRRSSIDSQLQGRSFLTCHSSWRKKDYLPSLFSSQVSDRNVVLHLPAEQKHQSQPSHFVLIQRLWVHLLIQALLALSAGEAQTLNSSSQ